MNDRRSVNGIRYRLPHPHIFQYWIPSVKCQIADHGPRRTHYLQIGLTFQSQHHVSSQRSDRDVGTALAQFECACIDVWSNRESHPFQPRLFAPVRVVALDDDFLIRLGANKTERPRADGMLADLVSTAVGDDSDRAIRNVPQQGEWLLQMKYHGERVGCIDVINGSIRGGFSAANFSLQQGIEGPLYVPRS